MFIDIKDRKRVSSKAVRSGSGSFQRFVIGLREKGIAIISLIFILYAFTLYLINWTHFAFSTVVMPLYEFDGALWVLPHFYMHLGLVPFRDFELIYSPGIYFLIGTVVPFVSIQGGNLVVGEISLVLTLLIALLIFQILGKERNKLFLLGLFFCVSMIPLDEIEWSEPMSKQLLLLIVVLLSSSLLGKNRMRLLGVFFLGILSVFFRWSIFIVYLFVLLGFLLLPVIVTRLKVVKESTFQKSFIGVSVFASGFLVGLTLLAAYLSRHHVLYEGYTFLVSYFFITHTYRSLPLLEVLLPIIIYRDLSSWLLGVSVAGSLGAAIYLSCKVLVMQVRRKEVLVLYLRESILLALPLSSLIYALYRPDRTHLAYLLFFLGVSTVLFDRSILSTRKKIVFSVLILMSYFLYFIPSSPSLPSTNPMLVSDLTQQLGECRRLLPKSTQYRSIFVGRVSYERFIVNSVALYLLAPQVKPATRYIIDDPGIQNSARFAKRIVSDLREAQKPMLTFLEEGIQPPEQNATRFMYSDKVIEDYLAKSSFTRVGECQAFGKLFLIRLYR